MRRKCTGFMVELDVDGVAGGAGMVGDDDALFTEQGVG